MKILTLFSLLLLVGVTARRDLCLAQLDDMFFYRLMPFPCNPEHFENPQIFEEPICSAGPDSHVQMEHVIGIIDANGELHGDSQSRLEAMGVSDMCIKEIRAQGLAAMERGEWTGFCAFDNGSVYEIVPIVPIFHHRLPRRLKLPGFERNK